MPCMGLTETAGGGWNDGYRMGGKGAGRYRYANMQELMEKLDIKSYEIVTEGLSGDRKFPMWETSDGGHFCCGCRMERSMNGRKRRLIEMRKADSIGIPMCRPRCFRKL